MFGAGRSDNVSDIKMKVRFALCLALVALTAAACGDDDASSPTPSSAPATSVAASSPASQGPTAAPSDGIDLATSAAELVAYGAGQGDFPSDQPGLAVADFNADGIDDFAAGARFADPGGRQDAGTAYVVFGSADPPATVDFAADEQDVKILGPTAGSSLGFSAAQGDLNGDGKADLVVGAPFATVDGAQRGAAYIFFGPLQPGTIDLSQDAAGVTLSGVISTGFFGDSLATGDVDGDGTQDLVIGATFSAVDSSSATQVGAVYVFLGSEDWPSDLTAADANTALFGEEQGDELGDFVVTGDVNGDEIDDIIATAEAADGPGNERSVSAEVHILYGRENFENDYGPGEDDVIIYGARQNDTIGFSLATGDLDGDGTDDLAMSAHLVDIDGIARAGTVYLLYGSEDIPSVVDMLSPPDGIVSIRGESTSDLLATSLAIADVTGDEAPELLVGGSFVDTRGRADAGSVFVLGASALSGSLPVTGDALLLRYDGMAPNDHLGSNISAGDIDGDGILEIVTIAENAAGPAAGRPGAGRVYVLKP